MDNEKLFVGAGAQCELQVCPDLVYCAGMYLAFLPLTCPFCYSHLSNLAPEHALGHGGTLPSGPKAFWASLVSLGPLQSQSQQV